MLLLDLPRQRDHDPLDRLVEADRVRDAVVEPLAVAERVLDEVGEPRLARDLDPELLSSGRTGRRGVSRSSSRRVGDELPGLLADGAVGLLQERGHLRQGPLLAAERDGHRADDLLILLLELGQLGLAGDVRLAKQGAAVLQGAVEDEVAVARQLRRGAASRGIGCGSRSGSA